jgi:hypothetical protein
MTTPSLGITALGFLASLALSAPAFANGGDFFEELAASFHDNSDDGVPYFGFVRDTQGKLLSSASIMATTPNGSSFIVQADNHGRYRIPGFSKAVDATKVQITCSKPGYKLITKDRRIMRGRANAPIETNCILAPDTAKPTA